MPSQRAQAQPASAHVSDISNSSGSTPKPRPPSFVGVISPRNSAEISAKITGDLADVKVRIGDRVEAGDVIATVDDQMIRGDLAIAKASAGSAKAHSEQMQVELAAAQEQLKTEDKLFARGMTSKRSAVEARWRMQKATASLAQSDASHAGELARVKQLRMMLARAQVVAPFAGTIALRHLDPGATVQPGTPIARIITASELLVVFAVPGDMAAALKIGRLVSVDIEALSTTVTGRITQMAPELEPASQMIIMEAELRIPEHLHDQIQSGLLARVRDGARH